MFQPKAGLFLPLFRQLQERLVAEKKLLPEGDYGLVKNNLMQHCVDITATETKQIDSTNC